MKYYIILLFFFLGLGSWKAATCTVTISNPTPTICAGKSVTLTAGGATTYLWSTGSTATSIVVTPGITTIYTLTGVAGTCTQVVTATVTVIANPIVTIAPPTLTMCLGSVLILTASGASTYSWSTGVTTPTLSINPAVTTSYSVTGTSAVGCKNTAIKTITVIALPIVSNAPIRPTICPGGSATLTASGASTYTWSTGATTTSVSLSPAVTTTYSVIGTAASGCTNIATNTVGVAPNPTVVVAPATLTVCLGSALTLTASGASTYSWSTTAITPTITVSPSVNTTYTVTGTSSSGCKHTIAVTVTVIPRPTLSIAPVSPTICSGSAITLTASGASTYNWNTGANTATVSVAPITNTTYTVIGIAITGCTNSTIKTVTVVAGPVVVIAPASPTICVGSSVTLTASGANTYSWNTGPTTSSIIVNPIVNTTYTVVGTSTATGCKTTVVKTVTVVPNPTVVVAPATLTNCLGSSITLTASGATTYSWSTSATTPTLQVSPIINTTYTVTGTTNGCKHVVVKTVTVVPSPVITIAPTSPTVCSGNSVTLTANGALTYNWSTGATTSTVSVSPSTNTAYTVTGTASNGCTNTATTTVNVINQLVVTNSSSSICAGSSVTLSASGSASYTWGNGATTSSIVVTPSVTTTYTIGGVTGTCVKKLLITIIVNPVPVVTVNNSNPLICSGGNSTLTANGAATYSWSNGAVTSPIVEVPTITTNYTVTGTNAFGCSASATTAITVNILNVILTNPTPSICAGSSATITASGAPSYTWSTGANTTSIVVNPAVTTNYSVIASNGICTNVYTTAISVVNLPVVVISSPSPSLCVGASATLTASGASSYTWNTGATSNSIIVSPIVTTTYAVTGFNGCYGSANFTLTSVSNNSLLANAGPDQIYGTTPVNIGFAPNCATGGTAPYTYLWSTSGGFVLGGSITFCSNLVAPTTTTIYSLTVTDAAGCQSTDDVLVLRQSAIINYIVPKKNIDAGYQLPINNNVYFKFEEEYTSNTLSYKIFDYNSITANIQPALVACNLNPTIKNLGDNRYYIDLAPCSSILQATKYYVVEITNDKAEKFYFKFLN
jgi:hypothetical protein